MTRRGTTVKVRWRAVAGAREYAVALTAPGERQGITARPRVATFTGSHRH